jgi:putative oxidoreductase
MDTTTHSRRFRFERALLAFVFLAAGTGKLVGAAPMTAMFAHFGFGTAFLRFIGAAEVAGAVGLFLPRVTALAAAGLAIVMIGAISEHVLHDPILHALPPLLLLGLCCRIAYATLDELTAAPLDRRDEPAGLPT